MTSKSFIEIWKVPTFFWTPMALPNWVIWMFPRSPKKGYCTHKLARLTMLRQRFGGTSHMITSRTSGPSAASCTRVWLWNRHSGRRTCKASTRRCSEAFTQRCPMFLVKIWHKLLRWWSRWRRRWDLVVIRFWICLSSGRRLSSSCLMLLNAKSHKWIY